MLWCCPGIEADAQGTSVHAGQEETDNAEKDKVHLVVEQDNECVEVLVLISVG